LNAASGGRYYVGWYVGKLETVAASAIVLMVLLGEINSLYGRLGKLATIDALTGLSNRQAFDNDARFALRLQERDPTDVAFLVVDVDFFKQYNDTYGHQAGDACLTRIAHCIRSACGRSIDLVGRFGGEEFVVFLQGTNASGASQVGETIRACVEGLGIAHAASTVAAVVTVSVGVTQAHGEHDIRLEALFKRADDALYRAKKTRNSVVMDDVPGPGRATRTANRLATQAQDG
jgi:diguanylate cyclase (GGDEF)-like protein